MNVVMAQVSDLAFEAALAGYVIALVCYAVELAAARGGRSAPSPAMVAEVVPAGARSRAAVATPGRAVPPAAGGIGRIERATETPWGERFGTAAVVITVVATAANIISVITRGLAVGRLPLGNMYEFTSVICALAMVCWLIVLKRTGARTLGVFVLLPVTVLAGVAFSALYVPAAPVVPALNSYWKWIHVTSIAVSSSILLISGCASTLYLIRARSERRSGAAAQRRTMVEARDQAGLVGAVGATGRAAESAELSADSVLPGQVPPSVADTDAAAGTPILQRLPTLATLDRIAYRTAIVGFPLFTFAVISGALWAEVAWGRYWGWDPKETSAFATWVVYAAYLHARSTAGWRGIRAAVISVIGLATIVFNLFFVNMVVAGLHSYAGLN